MISTLLIFLVGLFLLYVLVHDWVDIFPYNNVRQTKKLPLRTRLLVTAGNVLPPAILFALAIIYRSQPLPTAAKVYTLAYLGLFFILVWQSWYGPYLLGASDRQKSDFKREYGATVQILPARGDNPRPNLLHVVLHLLFLAWAIVAIIRSFG